MPVEAALVAEIGVHAVGDWAGVGLAMPFFVFTGLVSLDMERLGGDYRRADSVGKTRS